MSYIDIVPIGEIEDNLILPLQINISQTFKIKTRVRRCQIDLASVYDALRDQYNSSGLLLQLINDIPSETIKVLGITTVDLFIPIFTFLFGEAQLNGIGALVSIHRLQNEFYGIPEDKELLKNRLIKEAIHELGHTFGLIHCFTLRCVMNTSTYVEEIDQKSSRFCRHCEQKIFNWIKEKNILKNH
jgi:archaemetzincin